MCWTYCMLLNSAATKLKFQLFSFGCLVFILLVDRAELSLSHTASTSTNSVSVKPMDDNTSFYAIGHFRLRMAQITFYKFHMSHLNRCEFVPNEGDRGKGNKIQFHAKRKLFQMQFFCESSEKFISILFCVIVFSSFGMPSKNLHFGHSTHKSEISQCQMGKMRDFALGVRHKTCAVEINERHEKLPFPKIDNKFPSENRN